MQKSITSRKTECINKNNVVLDAKPASSEALSKMSVDIYLLWKILCLLDEPLALTDIFFYFYHFFNPRFLSNFNYNPYIVIRSKLKTRELSKTSKAEGLNIVILNMLITCSATLTLTFHCSSKH